MINRIYFLITIVTFILITVAILSCNKINPPYIDQTNKCANDSTTAPIRKILIEKFTGHKCGFCPEAEEKLLELQSIYCDYIIPVSIHAGFFAMPDASGNYTYDFRTEAGNNLNTFFGNSEKGLPNGLINRTEYNSTNVHFHDTWVLVIENIIAQLPELDIDISNNYDAENRTVDIVVNTKFLVDIEKTLYLSLFLKEDSIVKWQKNYTVEPNDVENYIHNHVLRKAINSTWGSELSSEKIEKSTVLNSTFSTTIDEEWNPQQCSIITFVYNFDSKIIIQVEEKKIISDK